MRAGELNTRVTVQRKVKTADTSGATVWNWQDMLQLWADVRHVSGLSKLKADQEISVVRASVRIRFRRDIDHTMRLKLSNGAVYDIKAVLPDEEGRCFVDLVCEKAE